MAAEIQVPVLIIGSSMVGMTLSALLAKQGIEGCLTVEKHASTAIHPRAALFHARTMQIFYELGLYDHMREEAAKYYDEHAGIVAVESLAGKFLQSYMSDMNQGLENISPTIRIFLTQQMFEPTLRDMATKHGADLRFSTELVSFSQDEGGVSALVRHVETGAEQRVRAKYMVASDGNRSTTRAHLNIATVGTGVLSRSLTIYFTLAGHHALANGKYNGVIYVDNEHVRGFFRIDRTGLDGFLVVFAAGEPGTEQSRHPADRMLNGGEEEILRHAIGADVPFTITHVATWEAKCDNAERYGVGRVLLVGDAAHTVTPQGGYGGNTGIQDTHNLAWKLAAVLRGQAHASLVEDTYNAERHPVGLATTRLVYEHYLDRTAPELRKKPRPSDILSDTEMELGYRYASRALVMRDEQKDGKAVMAEDPATAVATPGSLAHHVLVDTAEAKQVPVAFLLGGEFVLLLGPGADAWEDAAKALASREPALPRVKVQRITSKKGGTGSGENGANGVNGVNSDYYVRYDTSEEGAVLMRPDGVLAWSTSSPAPAHVNGSGASEPPALLAQVMRQILCFD